MRKTLLLPAVLFALLIPNLSFASTPPSDTSTWNFYQYADQTNPGQVTQINMQVKNTTTQNIDQISASVPNLHACLIVTAVTAQYAADDSYPASAVPMTIPTATCSSGVSGFSIGGTGTSSVDLKPGKTLNIYLSVNVSCISAFPPACDPIPAAPTSGDWQNFHYYHYTGTFASYDAIGNKTLTITNTPNPTQQPLNWGISDKYGNAITASGITDPTKITGWLPAGPVDTIILLPINLLTKIIAAAGGICVAPTFHFMGYSGSPSCGSSFWTALGTSVSVPATALFTFALLYYWFKSIYMRIERATSFQTTPDDSWGIL